VVSPISYKLPVYEFLESEKIDRIIEVSSRILAEIGIEFLDEECLEILRSNGVTVEGKLAFFPPELVEHYMASAPSEFTQLARNPSHNLKIGGDQMVFAPVYGPPFVCDFERGRRHSTLEDFDNFVKLAHMSPYIHHSGGTVVEPNDLPVSTRHLDMILSHVIYSDKAFMGSVTSAENAADTVAMAEIVFGAEAVRQNPAVISLINVNSPRRYDERMLGALKTYARARQAVIITPFILAGAMSPVTLPGTIAQQNAEALAGIVLTQMISPGTPVVYGSFLTNINLRSGSPAFGTPESQLALYVSAQIARRYKLPFRGGGMLCASKIPDAQAGYESMIVMSPAIMAGTNFILHAAGWLEGGLAAGYEKFVLDCGVLGMFHRWSEGMEVNEDTLAYSSIAEVEPGGHHLGTEHTFAHFRDAFHETEVFDDKAFEMWEADGALDAYARANGYVKESLDEFELPELDESIHEELMDFVARRKEIIPKTTADD